MIRRFNYTGRKKLARTRLSISLNETSDNRLAFDAALQLDGLDLPPSANIFIEAYRRAYFKRIACGTVSNPKFPKKFILEGLDPQALVRFRVKIADKKGRILAIADRIIPRLTEEEPTDKICLLPVDFVDLGQSIWRLDLDSDWPSLQLNKLIENIREIARSDNYFLTLVYPEIVRQVLYKIVVEEDHTDPYTDDDWMSQWLRFVIDLSAEKLLPPSGESEPIKLEKSKWIDDAVNAFSSNKRVLEKFIQAQDLREK